MGIVCIDESVWKSLIEKLKTLAQQAKQVREHRKPACYDKWLDGQDVCLALGITKRTLQSCREKGQIPFSNVNGKFYYREQDIANYLTRKTVK